jgi:hypothetical protein
MTDNKNPKHPFPDAVRALSEEERRGTPFVPTEDTLVAYQAGELPDEAADQVRRYLAIDPEAARFVADLDQFLSDVDDKSLHLSEHEAAQGLRELHRERGGGSSPGGAWFFKAAAAVFLVTTVVSLVWGYADRNEASDLESWIGALKAPGAAPPIGRIDAGVQRGSTRRLEFPTNAILVELQASTDTSLIDYSSFWLELEDARGRSIARVEVPPEKDTADFRLSVPTSVLPAGSYTLRVIGILGDGKERLLLESMFEVVYR